MMCTTQASGYHFGQVFYQSIPISTLCRSGYVIIPGYDIFWGSWVLVCANSLFKIKILEYSLPFMFKNRGKSYK